MSAPTLLDVEGLEITFPTSRGPVKVVRDVSFEISRGEVFGLIGETGAGKSMTAWGALGLVPPPGRVSEGSVRFDGQDLLSAEPTTLRTIRGKQLAVIVQNARSALNPMLTVGHQIAIAFRAHNDVDKRGAHDKAVAALRSVGIPDPDRRADAYPHELSGGMAQRALIALAMVNDPLLLIADEPTTGLDVTIQAEILDLMSDLVVSKGSSVWIITHDLGVIANYTERAGVMFAGELVELGRTEELFRDPRHPYTRGLVASLEREGGGDDARVSGPAPDLVQRPRGCQFAYRCPIAEPACHDVHPQMDDVAPSHPVRCIVAQREAERVS